MASASRASSCAEEACVSIASSQMSTLYIVRTVECQPAACVRPRCGEPPFPSEQGAAGRIPSLRVRPRRAGRRVCAEAGSVSFRNVVQYLPSLLRGGFSVRRRNACAGAPRILCNLREASRPATHFLPGFNPNPVLWPAGCVTLSTPGNFPALARGRLAIGSTSAMAIRRAWSKIKHYSEQERRRK